MDEVIHDQLFLITYSGLWMKSGIAVIAIAGSPKESWEQNKEALDAMQSFELIYMERFQKR